MARTTVALYDDLDDARETVRALGENGFDPDGEPYPLAETRERRGE